MQNLERKELFREFAIDMSKNFPKGKMQFVDRARTTTRLEKYSKRNMSRSYIVIGKRVIDGDYIWPDIWPSENYLRLSLSCVINSWPCYDRKPVSIYYLVEWKKRWMKYCKLLHTVRKIIQLSLDFLVMACWSTEKRPWRLASKVQKCRPYYSLYSAWDT